MLNKINFEDYNLMGGSSSQIPEGLINEDNIVFIEDDIIITRHMASYYWWEKKNSTNILNYCRATAKIKELKLMDKGYPLTEL